jgi:hypothetical protein
MKRLPNSRSDRAFFPLSQDWERGRVRVGGGELHGGPSFPVITLTPPLSRKPGEGVAWSRPDKGLFGAEGTENTEEIMELNRRTNNKI